MLRWYHYLLIALVGLGLFLLWLVAVIPPRPIDTSGIPIDARRLDEVIALRTTVAGVLGGLVVTAGAVVAALNFRETSRQNRAVLEPQRRIQVTKRVTRAIEQLKQGGDGKLFVRIGAVYALERMAQDSAELHWPVMEVLTAYLRENAPISSDRQPPSPQTASEADIPPDGGTRGPDSPKKRLPADHQAIATVIGRRRTERDLDGQNLNLSGVSLPGVNWTRAHLEAADLIDARLEGAILVEAHLDRADLRWAHLGLANLARAHLEGAVVSWAHLGEATLVETHLDRAELVGAHLEGANLRGASLDGAVLREAHLEGAYLVGADLSRAYLEGAHLEGARFGGEHLHET